MPSPLTTLGFIAVAFFAIGFKLSRKGGSSFLESVMNGLAAVLILPGLVLFLAR